MTYAIMQKNKGFIIACCLLWASMLSLFYLGDTNTGFILTLFLVPTSIVSWFILSGIATYRVWVRDWLPWQKRLVPLHFSVTPLVLWFTVGMLANTLREDSTWLIIKNADFHGSNNFKFYKNGKYSTWRDSPLGRSSETSGRYERQDSILILHTEPKDGKAKKFKLAIRPYSEFKRQQSSSHITLVTLDTSVQDY